MARYNIAQLRKDEGMTQQELASRLKISQGFLSSIETAKNNFPADKVEILKNLSNCRFGILPN